MNLKKPTRNSFFFTYPVDDFKKIFFKYFCIFVIYIRNYLSPKKIKIYETDIYRQVNLDERITKKSKATAIP